MNMYHLFNGKTEEWEYEQEYRIITESQYYKLDTPVKRIFLGPQIPESRAELIRKIVPASVEVIQTTIGRVNGELEITSPNK